MQKLIVISSAIFLLTLFSCGKKNESPESRLNNWITSNFDTVTTVSLTSFFNSTSVKATDKDLAKFFIYAYTNDKNLNKTAEQYKFFKESVYEKLVRGTSDTIIPAKADSIFRSIENDSSCRNNFYANIELFYYYQFRDSMKADFFLSRAEKLNSSNHIFLIMKIIDLQPSTDPETDKYVSKLKSHPWNSYTTSIIAGYYLSTLKEDTIGNTLTIIGHSFSNPEMLDSAMKYYHISSRLKPSAGIFFTLAQVTSNYFDNHSSALNYLLEAEKTDSMFPDLHFGKGWEYFYLNDTSSANKEWNKLVMKFPTTENYEKLLCYKFFTRDILSAQKLYKDKVEQYIEDVYKAGYELFFATIDSNITDKQLEKIINETHKNYGPTAITFALEWTEKTGLNRTNRVDLKSGL